MFQFTLVLVYAIALLGLNILTGYNGQISLGHGAFYAVGAYTAAILMDQFGVPVLGDAAGRRRWSASSSASCSACRRCAWRATTWRWPPSRWRVAMPQILKYKRLRARGPAACRASCIIKPDAARSACSAQLTPTSGCTSSRWRCAC